MTGNKFFRSGRPAHAINAGFGDFSLQPGRGIMAEDRIFAAGFVTLGVISSALLVWLIFLI